MALPNPPAFLAMSLQDADENLAIDDKLLCQIEAESWVNGTRGILVESRAPPISRLQQNLSLLPASIGGDQSEVELGRLSEAEGGDELYSMPWKKLQVSREEVSAFRGKSPPPS